MKFNVPILVVAALGVLLGLAAGGGGVWWYTHLPAPAEPSQANPGQRLGNLPSFLKSRPAGQPTEVAALGRLAPRGEVIDIGGITGDRLEKLEVVEGQTVSRGTILGILASHEEREAERDATAAQLDEAKARRDAETAYYDAQVKGAEVGVRQAKELAPLDIQAQEAPRERP